MHDLHDMSEETYDIAREQYERAAALSRLHDEHGNVRPTRAEHVREPREQQQPLVRRRMHEGDERPRVFGRDDAGPVDRRFDRRADQPYLALVHAGQKPAARERMIDVGKILPFVIAEPAYRIRRRLAALSCSRHRLEDHRMAVGRDQDVRGELVQQRVEQRDELRRFRAIGVPLVFVPGEEQRDADLPDRVAHDRTAWQARRPGLSPRARRRSLELRALHALLCEVLFDREGHRAL